MRVWFGMAAAALLAVAGALGAAAKDTIHVRLNNPTDMEWKVEVRDMVCDNAVVWQGRMKPGEAAKVTVCADGNGAARLATAVIAGCASAKRAVYQDVADGATIDVAVAEDEDE
ncbi:MAG TPA: hypothetical protein VGB88_01800 [Alphaproteobacteria bacterium]